MGLFDTVTVDGAFQCINGHVLDGAEFQTKDIGEWPSMGQYSIKNGVFDGKHGEFTSVPPEMPYTGVLGLFGHCTQCTMKSDYGQKYGRVTEFAVNVEGGRVIEFKRMDNAFDTLLQRSEEGELQDR